MLKFTAAALAALAAPAAAELPAHAPEQIVLSAPWTPFAADGSLNASAVPAIADVHVQQGANTVWVAGGMGQFDGLTVDERKELAEAWIPACKERGLFSIIHVGTSVMADAIELAAHAEALGADAIASVPSYYETISNAESVVEWLKPLTDSSSLPFFYYHIPGSTGANIKITDFLAAAEDEMPTLAGVKYVDSDLGDWTQAAAAYSDRYSLLFAPEPKLASFALGPQAGTVLAEVFYAPTFLRMWDAFWKGDYETAQAEQLWKSQTLGAIYSKYPGGTRATMKALGVDVGPSRAPGSTLPDDQYDAMVAELTAAGFFNQTMP